MHTKVVLQGDGGDEVFGGYRRYATLKHYRWLHLLAGLGKRVHGIMPPSDFQYRVRRYLNAYAAGDLGTTMALLLTFEDVSTRPACAFSARIQEVIERADPFARYRECQQYFAQHDVADQMLLVDLMVELPDIFLEKVDRATMASSLEVRVPFLDHDLVDYVVRIPGETKIPWGKKKWLLKQAMRGIVPDEVLYGPKTGFNVPFRHWLKTSLKPLFFDHLAKFNCEQPGVLNSAVVHEWYRQCEIGQRDYSFMLWKLLNLMVWCNNAKISIEL
jgi:asparagine synthase (glutamine-hydrolysing)